MAKKTEIITTVEGYELPPGSQEVTPEDSVVPIYLVPLTAAEIAEREQWAADAEAALAAQEKAENDLVAAKQSALTKLAKLGLTEEEAKAVIGL